MHEKAPGAFASGLGFAFLREPRRGLEAFLRVSRYDFFLLVVVEVYEVVAVARDADEEAAIVVRVGLGVAQRRFVDDVELDVVSAEFEVGADEVLDAFNSLFAGEDGGRKRWLSSVPPDLTWSILPSDLTTAVGPWRSAPWLGLVPSDSGIPLKRPFGVAASFCPK